MNDVKISIKGWKVIPVLVVLLVIVGYKYYAMRETLDTAATQVIKTWILAEYVGKGIDNLKLQNLEAMSPEQAELAAEQLLKLNRIDIKSIKARGKGDDIVVRVEITVDGKTPPDGKRIRYFRMKHSMITGWTMKRGATSLSYYLKLW